MLNKIVIGRYYLVESIVHKLHPFSKIVCVLIFAIMTLLIDNYLYCLLLGLLMISAIIFTKIPIKLYLNILNSFKWFLISILVLNFILSGNFEESIVNVLKIVFITLYSSILTLTTPPTEINFGLVYLFKPLKIFGVPINKMALSITLALRFIPSIFDSGTRILKAQANRGVDYKYLNLKGKLLSLRSLIIPLFILTLKKADDLADSMETRLYDIDSNRVNFRENSWGIYDTIILIIHIFIWVIVVRSLFI